MSIEKIEIGFCKNCKNRDLNKICQSNKLTEDWGEPNNNNDMLIYPYEEGGYFEVSDNFGCVHFEEK